MMGQEVDGQLRIAVGWISAHAGEQIDQAVTLEDKLRAAMKEGHDYWASTDDDLRLRASVGAVISGMDRDSDDYQRIILELQNLRALGAALSGVPVAFDQIEPMENPVGIVKLWEETRQ